jgi:class 3 adenylate cyclase/tetratricopeptide (TPR) repeat protein
VAAPTSSPLLAEERRWVSVLFADLSGFTRASERMDPEDVRSLVDRCMALMGEIVVRYGGFVERVIGDQLVALFGAPVAHEDDAERAVRAALELQRCAREHVEAFGGLPLRVGVNTGEVMFAPLGPEGARHHTVMGDVVNTASRLQTAAPVEGILVGEETHRATCNAVRYAPVAPFAVKGKDAPLPAWRPLEALAAPSLRPLSTVPMVGRDAELQMLWRIWERVVTDRRPHMVTVLGSPGIGKTRLARELVALAEAGGGRCLHGRSLPYGERTGYGAFAEQVKAFAGIFETDSVPEARSKLATACVVLPEGDASQVASHLAVLVGLGGDGRSADKAPLLYSARRFVEAVAASVPTIFVFEDLHWADPSLLELVESLAGRARHSAALLLTVARPELLELRPAWGGGLPSYTALALDALPEERAQALAVRLAPHLAPEAAARLAEVAEGNPLFIEELAASVSDAPAELLGTLPTTVKGTIAARLDALPPAERQTILDASVVGKLFWLGALERLAGERDLPEVLDSLERRDFLRREPSSRFEGDVEFSFRHMLIREVAYATLPKAGRRERHAAVARFLEDAARERLAEFASLLAHHWREAGDSGRALDYLLRAADHARRAWASGEAVRLYDEALELVPATDKESRGEIRLARAFAMFEAGDLSGVAIEVDGLLPQLMDRQRAEALFLRAQTAMWLADQSGLGRLARELAELADRLGDKEYGRLGLLALSEHTLLGGSLEESIRMGDQALASWPAEERRVERSYLLGQMGLGCYFTGDFHRSRELNDAGWRLGREVGSMTGFLFNGPQAGLALAGLDRHEEAVAHLEWILTQARGLELVPRWTSRCLGMYAGVLYEMQLTDEARQLSEEAIECSRQAAFPNAEIMARIDLLSADTAAGALDRAEAAWPALWEGASDLKGWHEWLARGRLLVARADLILALGRPATAAEAAAAALDHWRRYPRPKYRAAALATLGQALLVSGRPIDGLRELRHAAETADRLGHGPTIWRVTGKLISALAATGDDDGANAAYSKVTAAIDNFRAGLSAEHQRAFLAAPPIRQVLAAGR